MFLCEKFIINRRAQNSKYTYIAMRFNSICPDNIHGIQGKFFAA